jgi:hypothetical protein
MGKSTYREFGGEFEERIRWEIWRGRLRWRALAHTRPSPEAWELEYALCSAEGISFGYTCAAFTRRGLQRKMERVNRRRGDADTQVVYEMRPWTEPATATTVAAA